MRVGLPAIAMLVMALAIAGCGGSSSSQSSLDTPQDATGPKVTDPAQIKIDVQGPLDQLALDGGRETARDNAIQYEARSQGSMTSTDPALVNPLLDNYGRIAHRWATICQRGRSHKPSAMGDAEAEAWRTGLQWCDSEAALWASVSRLLRAAFNGAPLSQKQRDQGNADYFAAETAGKSFKTAYTDYLNARG